MAIVTPNVEEAFRSAIAAAGLTPPDVVEPDGTLHRFSTNGKRGDDAGWYVMYGDGIPSGAFGCWRTGASGTWRAEPGRSLSPAEQAAYAERVASTKRERDAELERRRARARGIAEQRWSEAKPADPTHPYLAKKQVKAHGIRQEGEKLLVPMRAGPDLHSLQTIDASGVKRFVSGGRVAGCYHSIGKPGGVLCIVEGYATGASVHETTGLPVAVAFNAGNLEAVARSLRARMPDVSIVICADDDAGTEGNPGLTKAREAARAVGGFVALPDFGPDRPEGATDFNDLARHRGAEAVREAVERASAPEAPNHQPSTPNAVAADPVSAWPDPEPLTAGDDAMPYPIAALPPDIREAVEEVVAFVQCPAALAGCSALSALSLAGQALADVERVPGLLKGPSSLYLLAVADSGERKSTCDGYFLEPIRIWEREEAERWQSEMTRCAAEFAAWEERKAGIKARIRTAAKDGTSCDAATRELAEVEAAAPKRVRVPRLIHSDATPEALAWGLAKGWPSGGVMSSEAGIVFGGHAMGRESVMRNLSQLNVLWDGGALRVERRTSESFTLDGARLTMGLAVQPETVRQFVEGTKGLARGSGFAARFLIAAPESTQGTRLFRDAPAWRYLPAFAGRLRALLAIRPNLDESGALAPALLAFSAGARAAWRAFHDDVERELRKSGAMADLRDVGSKAADNVARMAALFHLYANGPEGEIQAPAVEAAAWIVTWHLYQARAFLGDVAAPRELSTARKLDAWLRDRCAREGVSEISRRTIQNEGPNTVRGSTGLESALATLADAHRVRQVEDGRRKLVLINPALLGGSSAAP